MDAYQAYFPLSFSRHVTFVESKLKHRRTCNGEDNISCEMLTSSTAFLCTTKLSTKKKGLFVEWHHCLHVSLCLNVGTIRVRQQSVSKNDRYIKVNKRRMMSSTSFQLFKKGVCCNSTLLKVVTIPIFIQIDNTQWEHV